MHRCARTKPWLALAVAVCTAPGWSGCAWEYCPRIDPTGTSIFAPPQPRYRELPDEPTHHNTTGVCASPTRIVAPVGSEVVVLASVCGPDGLMRSREEVQWTIAPGGVGHLVALGEQPRFDRLCSFAADCLWGTGQWPRKVSPTYAIGETSSRYLTLTRGTPTKADDLSVQRGQAWITVTSPVEGVSHVNAFAPQAYAWDGRLTSSTIVWVDAQAAFPPPAINAAGTRHTFVTSLTRISSRAPVSGWRVRYQIQGGPPAAFAPGGGQSMEVITDSLGQAAAEIYQVEETAGTNQVLIDVLRPAPGDTVGEAPQVVATGSTSKTWTSSQLAITHTGPPQGAVGGELKYRITIQNPSDTTARDVVASEEVPQGVEYVSSTPQATVAGRRLEWRLGDLQGGESRQIEVSLRANQAGTANVCASVQSLDGRMAQECVTTSVTAPSIDVRMVGPESAEVGTDVTFEITVTNRGATRATGLVVIDRYALGMTHETGRNPIERALDDLDPGQSTQFGVTFRVTQQGRLCNTVEIYDALGVKATTQACVNVGGPADAASVPELSVEKTGPATGTVGDTVRFEIRVTNTGRATLSNLQVVDSYDAALDPIQATRGYQLTGDEMIWRRDTLEPGRSATYVVECECLAPAARACNRVTVTAQEGAQDESEACLEISGPLGAAEGPAEGLSVQVVAPPDATTAGAEAAIAIRVTNNGSQPERQVALTATLSAELEPLRVGTTGPSTPRLVGQQVQFGLVQELAPAETLLFRIQFRARRPGVGRIQVQVASGGSTTPLQAEGQVEVTPADSTGG